jgi:hypothetical protein
MKITDELINKLSEDALASEAKDFNVSSYSQRTVVFLAGYLSAVLLVLGPRDDWLQQFNQAAYAVEILLTLFLIVSAGIASVRFSVPKALKQSTALLLPTVSVALGLVIWQLGEVSGEELITSATDLSLSYISLGVIAGATPVALFLFWQMSQGSPTQLSFASGMALLSASACGHLLMRTIGQASNFSDVLVWCYSPILLLMTVGALSGNKLLRW